MIRPRARAVHLAMQVSVDLREISDLDRLMRARNRAAPAVRKGPRPVEGRQVASSREADQAADLIAAIAAHGDREAFADLFTRFAPRVKSYLMGLGASAAAAEELAQDTLLAVWRKASYFDRTRAGASTWIFTIARNLRIDAARRERSALAYTQAYHPPLVDDALPDQQVSEVDRERLVREAMASLPPEQVEVVRMSFFLDKPHSEISQVLGIPLGTVKSRVRLGLMRLRAKLEDLA